jgi:hypothetical protein
VIANPTQRRGLRIVIDLLLRMAAIAFAIGLILVLLPAIAEAAA